MPPAPEVPQVLLAGEDRVHRALGRWFIGQQAPGVEYVAVGAGDWYDHKHLDRDLRARLKLPPGKPRFRDSRPPGGAFTRWLTDLVALAAHDAPGAVLVILKDTDGRELSADLAAFERWMAERRRGVAAAAVGTPHQDAEAWFVAGLASDPSISERRKTATRALTFDPCVHAERLTHAPNDADHDAKRVLAFLLGEGKTLPGTGSSPPSSPEALCERAFERPVPPSSAAATGLTTFQGQLRAALR